MYGSLGPVLTSPNLLHTVTIDFVLTLPALIFSHEDGSEIGLKIHRDLRKANELTFW